MENITYFTGLHGIGNGNHGIFLNFTGRVCTGSGFQYLNGTGSGFRKLERDQFGWDRDFRIRTRPRYYLESRGTPGIFSAGKRTPGIFSTGNNPEEIPGNYLASGCSSSAGPLQLLLTAVKSKYLHTGINPQERR